jgi:hypothetical protein
MCLDNYHNFILSASGVCWTAGSMSIRSFLTPKSPRRKVAPEAFSSSTGTLPSLPPANAPKPKSPQQSPRGISGKMSKKKIFFSFFLKKNFLRIFVSIKPQFACIKFVLDAKCSSSSSSTSAYPSPNKASS